MSIFLQLHWKQFFFFIPPRLHLSRRGATRIIAVEREDSHVIPCCVSARRKVQLLPFLHLFRRLRGVDEPFSQTGDKLTACEGADSSLISNFLHFRVFFTGSNAA